MIVKSVLSQVEISCKSLADKSGTFDVTKDAIPPNLIYNETYWMHSTLGKSRIQIRK